MSVALSEDSEKSPAAHSDSGPSGVVISGGGPGTSLALDDDPGRKSRECGLNRGLRGLTGLCIGSECRTSLARLDRYGNDVGKAFVGDGARGERI
jgi:hypothetical protein